MKTHIIYIPGLGDRYDPFRRASLKLWRLWGVTAQHVPITWYDGGSFDQKYEYVAEAIRTAKGKRIVLIGESAGGTLALLAGNKEPGVSRVITLCGVARPTTPVSQYLRKKAPALDTGVDSLPVDFSVDVHSVRAAIDPVVGAAYSSTKGATQHVIWSIGHLTTIVLCLTILAPIITAIAKKQ